MWDDVYAWVLAQVQGLSGLDRVYDGPPTEAPSEKKYAIVGQDSSDGDEAGTYGQDDEPIDTLTAENGEVFVRLVSRSGDTDLSAHRTTTKAWVTTLAAAVNADQTLGGVLKDGSTAHVRSSVRQPQTSSGSYVERAVTFTYSTRV